jgi:hypothetical protein
LQADLDFELVRHADSEGCQILSEIKTDACWWDSQDHLPAGATIVPVIFASYKAHLTNFWGDQHACALYHTIGNIRKDIWGKSKQRASILIRLILCAPKGAKNIDEVWHSAVGTVLSQLRHLDFTGHSLKWDCADGFQ